MSGGWIDDQVVDQLIQDLEDGVITPGDREKLMELMRKHTSVRELYLKHVEMVALLQESAESRAELGMMPVSLEMVKEQRRRSAMVSLTYGIAALLLLSVGFLIFQVSQLPDPEVRGVVMEGSEDAAFTLVNADGEPHRSKELEIGDKITLDYGLVKLLFPSGVEAIVEGPSQLELTSDLSIRMNDGVGWFRVPEAGHGFTVQTDRANVIDLGTEFGVRFDGGEGLQVHVARGKVRVEPVLKAMTVVELTKDQAMEFDMFGRSQSIDIRTSLFRRQFSARMPYIHWSFDKLIDGGFEADGTMPGVDGFQAELRHLENDLSQIDTRKHQINGKHNGAFSMDGKGLFVETSFPGIGGGGARTLAMWVRHRKENYSTEGNVSPYCVWGNPKDARWKVSLLTGGSGNSLHSTWSSVGYATGFEDKVESRWIHLASVYTGKIHDDGCPEVFHYINGSPVSRANLKHTEKNKFSLIKPVIDTDISSENAMPVRFGASIKMGNRNVTIDGDIDEAYLFRGVLKASQIKELMESNRLDFFSN